MLQREIVGNIRGQHRRRRRSSDLAWHGFGRMTSRTSCAPLSAGTCCSFIIPRGQIVLTCSRIESREQSILWKCEALLNDAGGVGVVNEIFLGDPVVLDRGADQPTQERDVAAGANLEEEVGSGGRASESRVYRDQLGIAVAVGLHRPPESAGMLVMGSA